MRSWLVLSLAIALAGCDSGGSSGPPPIPIPPWGNFRHDVGNSAASSVIDSNTGTVSLPLPIPGGATLSTPTIDLNGNILVGSQIGVSAYDPRCFQFPGTPVATPANRCPIFTVTQCPPEGDDAIVIGSVSASPTVTSLGTMVFASDGSNGIDGHLFAIQEPGDEVVCNWVYPLDGGSFSSRSSAATLINAVDLTLASVFIGGDDGQFIALNADGTIRWTRSGGLPPRPISSSPAIDGTSTVYLQGPDGRLTAVNAAGRNSWQTTVGAISGEPYDASPAVGTSVYAIGSNGSLFAINAAGAQKWQFSAAKPFRGSLAFVPQTFNQGASSLIDTIVYALDVDGRAYGVRDLTGRQLQVQGCSNDLSLSCTLDSCTAPDVCGSTSRCIATGVPCIPDSCLPNGACGILGRCSGAETQVCITPESCSAAECNLETNTCMDSGKPCTPCPSNRDCIPMDGFFVTGAPEEIESSPVLSADPFVLIGTPDGRLCARGIDGTIPGQDLTPPTETWADGMGCINVGDGQPIRSSPIIGASGQIYVTTDDGLYLIQ